MTSIRKTLDDQGKTLNKIAEITIYFWILKILATTLGEMFGDFIAQTLKLGYIVGLTITFALLLVVLFYQIRAQRFYPALFWLAIVATTTAGTEISDLMDRTLGFGYVLGSLILVGGLVVTLVVWQRREGNLSVDPIITKNAEVMFWIAVVFSNSLGTAFGDALVDVVGLSYVQGALVTATVIAAVLLLHYLTKVNAVALFWIAFIFTRPFGATFGDLMTKPLNKGGLDLGTLPASGVAFVLMAIFLFISMRATKSRQ